jgi:hypothetical protein
VRVEGVVGVGYTMRNANIDPLQSSACNSGLLMNTFVSIPTGDTDQHREHLSFSQACALLACVLERPCPLDRKYSKSGEYVMDLYPQDLLLQWFDFVFPPGVEVTSIQVRAR